MSVEHNCTDVRERFEIETYNALQTSMKTTMSLWNIYSSLHTENNGGGVSWSEIEENVWTANEMVGFTQTYVQDETGVVNQFKQLRDELEITCESCKSVQYEDSVYCADCGDKL